MSSEPLIPLVRAVAHEVTNVETELGVELGTVHLDLEAQAGFFRVRGGAL